MAATVGPCTAAVPRITSMKVVLAAAVACLATTVATAAAAQCPGGTTLVDAFAGSDGERWVACEDLQTPGGDIVLVSATGVTERFSKGYEIYGSAPSGSDEDYYLNMTKAAAFGAKTDALAIELLSKKYAGITWELVANTVPPIRKAGTRAVVGSRGSVADTTFTDAGEDAAGYGFPPAVNYVFNLTNIAEGGKPLENVPACRPKAGQPCKAQPYVNSSLMAEGLVGGHLPIVIFYYPVTEGSDFLPPSAAKGGSRYWNMIASPAPDMKGSREQTVWQRFQQVECAGPRMAPPCKRIGKAQYWDTFWWSNVPADPAQTNVSGPTSAASASGFYLSLLENRRWWAAELAARSKPFSRPALCGAHS